MESESETDMDNATADALSVPLNTLELEQEFASPIPVGNVAHLKWGRLLYIGVGSCLVEFVEDDRIVQVRIAPDTRVIPDVPQPNEKENVMATAVVNQQAQAILTRYKFQLNQLAGDNEEKQNVAISRFPKIFEDAEKAGVVLPAPESIHPQLEGHPVFEGITFGAALEAVEQAAVTEAPKTKAQKDDAKASARNAAVKEAKAKTPKADKPKREKKAKVANPCLDGCGEVTFGRFRPGHDAKLKSIILKVERGEEGVDAIPEVARPHVEFKKGDIMTEKDEKGKVISKVQTLICTKSPVKLPSR